MRHGQLSFLTGLNPHSRNSTGTRISLSEPKCGLGWLSSAVYLGVCLTPELIRQLQIIPQINI